MQNPGSNKEQNKTTVPPAPADKKIDKVAPQVQQPKQAQQQTKPA